MYKITQEEFNKIERNKEGYKIIPAFTDCTAIKSFGECCGFGKGCSFGEGCRFGKRCRFGDCCSFSECCRFGECCGFGKGCSFGEECRFGESCILENNKKLISNFILFANGFGSENRCTYFFPTKEGLFVRCSCFSGTLKEFKDAIKNTHKNSDIAKEYLSLIKSMELRYKRILKEDD